MPDTGMIFLSLMCIVVGALLFLSPNALVKLNEVLNRAVNVIDTGLLRYRYLVGVLAFVASYAFFKLALLLPSVKG